MFIAWFMAQDGETHYIDGIFDAVVGAGFELGDDQFESIPDTVQVQVFLTREAANEWLVALRCYHQPG